MDEIEDGRRLSRETQHERRKQAVRLHRRGMKTTDIAQALSMSPTTFYAAIKAAEQRSGSACAATGTIASPERSSVCS